ncbi:hypothetical protein N8I77_006592 [Diaporthe amygdali]|uniref:Uncharacterized protein n=1 Tax=Phomopsis amygdali TaxID=1214568 RepID=A0AAD9SI23_PHOAM|nr:hypothetical protein N8I77_006592 [Diaporthe amygdali]
MNQYDMVSLHALYKYKVPEIIPLDGEIPISQIAQRCNAREDSMTRLLEHAVANYVLARPRPGHVAHTALSAMLATSPPLMDWVGSACEDMWPAAPHVVTALKKWPVETVLPHQTGHNLAERTDEPFFTTMGNDTERAGRFARAMGFMQNMPGFQPAAALDAYDWGAVASASDNAVVVDVGGSRGDFAFALTEKHPSLQVVVQDMPDTVEQGRAILSKRDVSSNVTFQAHDFFDAQPVEGADAYFLRMILHDWPDEFCLKILRNIVPALKPGARLIINDHCISSPGTTSLYQERQAR